MAVFPRWGPQQDTRDYRMCFSNDRVQILSRVKVTYPYIMAKVRIQARSVDVDDESAHGQLGDKQQRPKGRQAGAVEILGKVWQREGFLGLYQVRPIRRFGDMVC